MAPKEQVLSADTAGAAGNQELDDDQLVSPLTDDAVTNDVETDDDEQLEVAEPTPERRERAGVYLATLIALAVPSLIVLAILLPQTDTSNSFDEAIERTPSTGLDELDINASLPPQDVGVGDVEVASAVEQADAVDTQGSAAATAPTESAPAELPAELVNLSPEAVEVLVYDESPMIEGEFTFAIRVKNVDIEHEVDVEHFTIAVENAEGEQAQSLTRFVHDSLPVGSSAIAAVGAADTGSSAHFVVVSIGDVEVGRVHIDVT